MKIHEHDAGHMTKMAATHLYGKNTSKIFFSGTHWPFPRNLVCSIMDSQPIIVCSNDDPGGVDHDLFYGKVKFGIINGKVKFGNLGFFLGKIEKRGFFRNYWSLWPESW